MRKYLDVYKNKKVYITGITGFKGSWLAILLDELGAEVSGYGLENRDKNSVYRTARVEEVADVQIYDILGSHHEEVEKRMKESDFIFHLAAQPIVSIGYQNPVDTFLTNILGTLRCNEAIRSRSTEQVISFLNVTTDKVYRPNLDGHPHTEDEALCGVDPYSASKSCSDILSQSYQKSFVSDKNRVSTARGGNVIGGGDFAPNRIMTDLIKFIRGEEELLIRNPEAVRPYQFVLDCLMGYLVIASAQYIDPSMQGEYNVGPNKDSVVTTRELVMTSAEITGKYPDLSRKGDSIGKETGTLLLDSNKLRSATGWTPYYPTIRDILKVTLEWYNEDEKGLDITRKQIKELLCKIK